MILPEDKQLNIQALSSAFSNMSESYKLFWIKGILTEIKAGNKIFTFGSV